MVCLIANYLVLRVGQFGQLRVNYSARLGDKWEYYIDVFLSS